eukprot:3447020-Prymnesium_polylepis.1
MSSYLLWTRMGAPHPPCPVASPPSVAERQSRRKAAMNWASSADRCRMRYGVLPSRRTPVRTNLSSDEIVSLTGTWFPRNLERTGHTFGSAMQ